MPGEKIPEPNNLILDIHKIFENNNSHNNIFLENKIHSLAFHSHDSQILFQIRKQISEIYNLNKNNLNILDGHNMFEIRPEEASKAKAALKILKNLNPNKIIYIGDDTTDEEAMEALEKKFEKKSQTQLKTIRVLNNKSKNQIKTCASQTFKNTEQVLAFLNNLT